MQLRTCFYNVCSFVCLFVLMLQSTIFQSCPDNFPSSWVGPIQTVDNMFCSMTHDSDLAGSESRTNNLITGYTWVKVQIFKL